MVVQTRGRRSKVIDSDSEESDKPPEVKRKGRPPKQQQAVAKSKKPAAPKKRQPARPQSRGRRKTIVSDDEESEDESEHQDDDDEDDEEAAEESGNEEANEDEDEDEDEAEDSEDEEESEEEEEEVVVEVKPRTGAGRGRKAEVETSMAEKPSPTGRTIPLVPPFKSEKWTVIKNREASRRGFRGGKLSKNISQILTAECYELLDADKPTYENIGVGPSCHPRLKYCDLTGFPAKYTDPKTGLHYADLQEYKALCDMPNEDVQKLLAIRGASKAII